MTQNKTRGPLSEHQEVARDERENAMDEHRERAHETGADEGRDHRERGGPGQWPGKEITRDAIPNADDVDDDAAEDLPDDIQRDISQEGVMSDPNKTVDRAP